MAIWSKIAEENGASVSVNGNVRFGIPGTWTSPVAYNGPAPTTAAAYGAVSNPALLGQIQSDAPDARNLFVKIMLIGDQITSASGATGYRTQLFTQLKAESRFRPFDLVGNAIYTANDGTSDPDHNGYSPYVATDLNKAGGTGTAGTGYLGDARDVTAWFNEQAPDIVILHLGTNDCANGAIVTANITTAYAALVAAARAAKPSVVFYVCKLIGSSDVTINPRITALNTAIAAWAPTVWTALSPVEVIDMNTGFNTATMLATTILPNAAGATFMATQVFNALDPWLYKPLVYPFPTGPLCDRVKITLRGPWTGPIDLTSAINWWTASASGTDLMIGSNRKAGPAVITVTQVGADAGVNQADPGTFTWTGGNNPASANGNHLANTQTIGNGFSISIPMAKWPDWQYARIWFSSNTPQINVTAHSDDSQSVDWAEYYGGLPSGAPDAEINNAYSVSGTNYLDVRFASDKPGRTLTVTMTRTNLSMGYWILNAVALYPDAPNSGSGLGSGVIGGIG